MLLCGEGNELSKENAFPIPRIQLVIFMKLRFALNSMYNKVYFIFVNAHLFQIYAQE